MGTYGQVVLIDTSTWRPEQTFRQVEDSARALAFRADGLSLAIGHGLPSMSGKVTLWDLTPNGAGRVCASQKDTVEALAFSADGAGLLLGSSDNKARYLPALPAADGPLLDDHNGRVQAAAISPVAHTIFATGGADKAVKIWDEKTRKAVLNFDQAEGPITGLAFLPSGTELVGASLDGKLYGWQIRYDARQQTYAGGRAGIVDAHPGGVYALSVSPDGKWLATTGADRKVILWQGGGGRKARTFTDALQPFYSVAVSPDGKYVAAGGVEGLVYIWSVDLDKLLVTTSLPPLPAPPAAKPVEKPKTAAKTGKHARKHR